MESRCSITTFDSLIFKIIVKEGNIIIKEIIATFVWIFCVFNRVTVILWHNFCSEIIKRRAESC